MKKYLIVLDLDGTLLYDWESISPKTSKYLKDLHKQGHKIVIATGRPFRSTEKFYKELELDTPIINYNGGLVTCPCDPDFKPYSVTIPKEYIIDIYKRNEDIIDNAFGEIGDDIYLRHDTTEIRPLLHYFNGATLQVGHFDDILDGDTNGFLILTKDGKADELEDFIAKEYDGKVLSRNWGSHYNYVIELYTPKTNKAIGVKLVADYLGFDMQDVIAFGDAHNDIEMLQAAGLGVAMKNAQDRLKIHANVITEYTNEEDGIVHFLEQFFKQNTSE